MGTYREQLSELVQDLINSYDPYLDEPEKLRDLDDLKQFLVQRGIHVYQPLTQDDLEEVKVLRTQLRALWEAKDMAVLAASLNDALLKLPIVLQVEVEGKGDWHINYQVQSGLSAMEALQIQCLLGLVTILEAYGLERMGTCGASPCQDVFIDVSRNRSRRFCSDRCANRYNIAAYRERKQG